MAETLPSPDEVTLRAAADGRVDTTPGQNGPWVAPGSGQLVGYARISTHTQSLDRQISELQAAGCERIFTDQMSGAKMSRDGLGQALDYVRAGDTLVVVEMSRLGRDVTGVLNLCRDLAGRSVGFRVLNLGLDLQTPIGRFAMTLFSAVAEMERELLRERVRSGIAEAKRQGRTGGRPPALTSEQRRLAARLVGEGQSPTQVAELLGCSERTVRRTVAATKAAEE